jgi:hypothetical protein
MPEMEYVADHLEKKDCRRLVASRKHSFLCKPKNASMQIIVKEIQIKTVLDIN